MPAIYHHQLAVRNDEIDAQGHANNVAFIDWMQRAAMAHSTVQGWGPEGYRRLGQGWVVRSHQIKYIASAFAGEQIIVRTWIAEFSKMTCTRKYDIRRAEPDAPLASATTQWAFIDLANRRLARIPQEVLEAFELGPK